MISEARFDFVRSLIQTYTPWLRALIFTGIFGDISPNWYRVVGMKLSTTMYIQIFLILVKSALAFGFAKWARMRAPRAQTQPDMNKCDITSSPCRRPCAGLHGC